MPWQAAYRSTAALSGARTFVLGASGHIAASSPAGQGQAQPGQPRPRALPDDAQAWFDSATEHRGSWWPVWTEWLHRWAQASCRAEKPGSAQFKASSRPRPLGQGQA